MAQQRGMKRAAKVLKRKQKVARVAYAGNLKKAAYAEKRAAAGHDQAGHDHEGHDHAGHDHK